ncbi:hypothetical protein A6X21_07570 [Planctopirus hydrillae]|uniref:Uncharacterized protein n=1 Tax=Planctopirus hydrillae TaxID=1841610 RepID=A0A1C3E927_9PLAN|nr:hypothetical protein A6X21_07570 [Planctopirus hydrillae]
MNPGKEFSLWKRELSLGEIPLIWQGLIPLPDFFSPHPTASGFGFHRPMEDHHSLRVLAVEVLNVPSNRLIFSVSERYSLWNVVKDLFEKRCFSSNK